MTFLRILLVLIVALATSSAASAGDGRLEAARERWEKLSPSEQARVRERYDRLRSMPERDRASLEDRARFLAETIRRIEERLTPQDRARVDGLTPERRRALLRDLALVEGGDRFARVHGAPPHAWRERFERLPPEQRERMLSDMQRRSRGHGREQLSEVLAKKLGQTAEETERILALPELERLETIHRLRHRSEGDRARPDDEAAQVRRRLFDVARPRSSDHLRYAESTPAERRELVMRIARQRALSVLRDARLADEDEIGALDALSDEEFRRALFERFARPRGREGERGGDRRGTPRER